MKEIYINQSTTIIILIITAVVFAVIGILYSKKNNSLNEYLNANRSVKSSSLTASLIASCFGVWILIGPAEAATWGGVGAILGYAFGQATPFLAFYFFGKRLRKIMPNGNSLTQFVYLRFGSKVFNLVLFLTIFYMIVYLTAEVTAVAKVLKTISGIPLWQTALVILISTLSYTLYGGLKVSIFTDKIQFIIIIFFLILSLFYIFNLDSNSFRFDDLKKNSAYLLSTNYYYGYTSGITFFIAVFATNLFDQGIWQRVYAAKSINDLRVGFISSFIIVIPFIFILGFLGLVAVSTGKLNDPSTIFFSLLLDQSNSIDTLLLVGILILVLVLVISSMDTLINAISSLITVESRKFIKLKNNDYLKLSKLIIIFLSLIIFYTASQGNSVLFMFLFADLLCCAAAIPVFYGLYSKKLSSKITFTSILMGLIFGLAFFPDQSFQKSLVVGNLIDVEFFPTWFSTALLFWSFIFALLVPLLIIKFSKKNNNFNYLSLKKLQDVTK